MEYEKSCRTSGPDVTKSFIFSRGPYNEGRFVRNYFEVWPAVQEMVFKDFFSILALVAFFFVLWR